MVYRVINNLANEKYADTLYFTFSSTFDASENIRIESSYSSLSTGLGYEIVVTNLLSFRTILI